MSVFGLSVSPVSGALSPGAIANQNHYSESSGADSARINSARTNSDSMRINSSSPRIDSARIDSVKSDAVESGGTESARRRTLLSDADPPGNAKSNETSPPVDMSKYITSEHVEVISYKCLHCS